MASKNESIKVKGSLNVKDNYINNNVYQKDIKEEDQNKSIEDYRTLSKRLGLLITILYITLTIISSLKGFYLIGDFCIISIFINFSSFIFFSIEYSNKKFMKILFGTFICFNYTMFICFLTFITKNFGDYFFNEKSHITDLYYIILDINLIFFNIILFLYDSGKILIFILNSILISCVVIFYKDHLEYKILIYILRIFSYIFSPFSLKLNLIK